MPYAFVFIFPSEKQKLVLSLFRIRDIKNWGHNHLGHFFHEKYEVSQKIAIKEIIRWLQIH